MLFDVHSYRREIQSYKANQIRDWNMLRNVKFKCSNIYSYFRPRLPSSSWSWSRTCWGRPRCPTWSTPARPPSVTCCPEAASLRPWPPSTRWEPPLPTRPSTSCARCSLSTLRRGSVWARLWTIRILTRVAFATTAACVPVASPPPRAWGSTPGTSSPPRRRSSTTCGRSSWPACQRSRNVSTNSFRNSWTLTECRCVSTPPRRRSRASRAAPWPTPASSPPLPITGSDRGDRGGLRPDTP